MLAKQVVQSINLDHYKLKIPQKTSERKWDFAAIDWIFINPYAGDLSELFIYKRKLSGEPFLKHNNILQHSML